MLASQMHVSQYRDHALISFANNQTTEHLVQVSLSSSESFNKNWQKKKQQKAENRTEKELTTPVLGMSVI